jgi:hypothetical protein
MTYSNEIGLTFNCNAFVPDISSASISLLSSAKGPTGGLFALVQSNLALITKGKKLGLATVCPLLLLSMYPSFTRIEGLEEGVELIK